MLSILVFPQLDGTGNPILLPNETILDQRTATLVSHEGVANPNGALVARSVGSLTVSSQRAVWHSPGAPHVAMDLYDLASHAIVGKNESSDSCLLLRFASSPPPDADDDWKEQWAVACARRATRGTPALLIPAPVSAEISGLGSSVSAEVSLSAEASGGTPSDHVVDEVSAASPAADHGDCNSSSETIGEGQLLSIKFSFAQPGDAGELFAIISRAMGALDAESQNEEHGEGEPMGAETDSDLDEVDVAAALAMWDAKLVVPPHLEAATATADEKDETRAVAGTMDDNVDLSSLVASAKMITGNSDDHDDSDDE